MTKEVVRSDNSHTIAESAAETFRIVATHVASFVKRLVTPVAEKYVTTSIARISTPMMTDMAIDIPKMIVD
jgi:hypothetical protein